MKRQTQGKFLAILSAVIFGLNPILAKVIYANGGNSIELAFFRMLFGGFSLFLAHFLVESETLRVTRTQFKKLFICSLGYCSTPLLLFSSYQYLSSGMATTIHFVYPTLVLIGDIVFFKEKITARKFVCGGLCMLGSLCFYTPNGTGSLLGILLAFISGITYSFYIIYLSRSGLQDIPPFKLAWWLCGFSSVEVGLVAVLMRQLTFSMNGIAWCSTIIFAVICTSIATVAFQLGAKYCGPETASMLSTFEPLTSVIVGILIYHERLSLRSAVGIVCILSAVVLLTTKEKEKQAE